MLRQGRYSVLPIAAQRVLHRQRRSSAARARDKHGGSSEPDERGTEATTDTRVRVSEG